MSRALLRLLITDSRLLDSRIIDGDDSISGRTGRAWPQTTEKAEPRGPRGPAAETAELRPYRRTAGIGGRPPAASAAAQVRAHVGVAVCIFPPRRVHHGRGPGSPAAYGNSRPALRRCARSEPRLLRRARRETGLRLQRFRREHPRALGVGREAHGRQHRACMPRGEAQTASLPRPRSGLCTALLRLYLRVFQDADPAGGAPPDPSRRSDQAGLSSAAAILPSHAAGPSEEIHRVEWPQGASLPRWPPRVLARARRRSQAGVGVAPPVPRVGAPP